jgi:hypothetical protein
LAWSSAPARERNCSSISVGSRVEDPAVVVGMIRVVLMA